MKKWVVPLIIVSIFVFLTALFLTPSFTEVCTVQLIGCLETGMVGNSFWGRIWAHLGCVFSNVICVLGGLF